MALTVGVDLVQRTGANDGQSLLVGLLGSLGQGGLHSLELLDLICAVWFRQSLNVDHGVLVAIVLDHVRLNWLLISKFLFELVDLR